MSSINDTTGPDHVSVKAPAPEHASNAIEDAMKSWRIEAGKLDDIVTDIGEYGETMLSSQAFGDLISTLSAIMDRTLQALRKLLEPVEWSREDKFSKDVGTRFARYSAVVELADKESSISAVSALCNTVSQGSDVMTRVLRGMEKRAKTDPNTSYRPHDLVRLLNEAASIREELTALDAAVKWLYDPKDNGQTLRDLLQQWKDESQRSKDP